MYGLDDAAFYDNEMSRLESESHFMTTVQQGSEGRSISVLGIFQIDAGDIDCFRGTNLKRTVTAIFAASGQQMIGATFVTGYATYFLQLINIDNYFLASCILYVVMVLSTCAVFPLVEVVGRRTLIVPSLFVLCLLLLIIGIMGCIPNQIVGGWVIVACIYIWAMVYQLSIGATGFILASEVSTVRLRGATQALVTVTNAVWGLIMQFTIPYMINKDAGNLGGKAGFIFLGTGLITAVVGFFLFPETKVSRKCAFISELDLRGVTNNFIRESHSTCLISYTRKVYLLDISKKGLGNCPLIIGPTRLNLARGEKFIMQHPQISRMRCESTAWSPQYNKLDVAINVGVNLEKLA